MNYVKSFWWRFTIIYCIVAIVFFLLFNGVININLGLSLIIFVFGLLPPLFIAFLGIREARRTNHSISNILEGARMISAGDLNYRISIRDAEIFPELSQTFNKMADTVRSMVQDLDIERIKVGALLETMEDGVMVISDGKEIVLANGAARMMLGLQEPFGILRDHDLQKLAMESVSKNERRENDIELLEGRRLVMALAVPLNSTNEGNVLMTLHDLTTIKRMDTTRREFVSNVSHELRNPIASMKALVETLENGAFRDTSMAEDYLKRIHGEVNRMSDLVSELLDLSRLESGQDKISFSSVDITKLITEVHSDMLPIAKNKGAMLSLELEKELPQCNAEVAKLRRVLLNLVDNSIRFVSQGGQIKISATRSSDHRLIVVSVTDNGTGISDADVPHLFERFYKVDRSRSDSGTGLGLAIARHIVEAHGGTIWVESQYGVGSTFSFTLIPSIS